MGREPSAESFCGGLFCIQPTHRKLTEELAGELSRDFDLSGGEIENIARKLFIESLIFDQPPSYKHIRELCKEESIDDWSAAKKICF